MVFEVGVGGPVGHPQDNKLLPKVSQVTLVKRSGSNVLRCFSGRLVLWPPCRKVATTRRHPARKTSKDIGQLRPNR